MQKQSTARLSVLVIIGPRTCRRMDVDKRWQRATAANWGLVLQAGEPPGATQIADGGRDGAVEPRPPEIHLALPAFDALHRA